MKELESGAMGGALRAASNEFAGKLAAMTERVAAGRSADGESNVLSADVAAALAADVLSNPAEGIGAGAAKLDPDIVRAAIKKVNAEAAQRGEAPVVDAELQDAMVAAAPATAAQLLSKFPGDSHAVLAVLTAGTAEITSSKPAKGGKVRCLFLFDCFPSSSFVCSSFLFFAALRALRRARPRRRTASAAAHRASTWGAARAK